MSWKIIFNVLFFVIVISLLGFYWIAPFEKIDFGFKERNYNFSLNASEGTATQFYPKMRFPTTDISYKVGNCPLGKKDDMERAFEIISSKTILNFYNVEDDAEIFVTCDSQVKTEGGLFIAGEGGPTNITKTSNFNVIKKGKILLIRESQCASPNVGIHELLHVLGFDHSPNPNNIMYELSKCNQEVSQDITDTINSLYSAPSYADLSVENASAFMQGRYLNVNLTIVNNGLKSSDNSSMKIYADEDLVKEFEIEGLEIGYGSKIILKNILVLQISVKKLKFVIEYDSAELNKENNEMTLTLENKLNKN